MKTRRALILGTGLLAAAAVAVWWLEPVRAGAVVIIQPYLQTVEPGRAVILWAMKGRGAAGVVEVAAGDGAWRSVAAGERGLARDLTAPAEEIVLYRAEVGGLSARTAYQYRVLAGASVIAGGEAPLSFRTPGGDFVRFLAFGDSGDGSAAQARVAHWMRRENADFVLHTGDLAYEQGTFEQYRDYYFSVYAEMQGRAPFFPVPGNHDYYTQEGAVYRALLAEGVAHPHRAFDWGPLHVVLIDSNGPLAREAHGDESLRRWLEADLGAAPARWRIAVFHHTPFPLRHHKGGEDTEWARGILTPVLEKYGVRLVLNGHEHLYLRTKPLRDGAAAANGGGTVYVTTGGGGAVLHPSPEETAPWVAFERSALHFVRVTVKGREMKLEAVGEDGAVFDETTLTAGLPRLPRLGSPRE